MPDAPHPSVTPSRPEAMAAARPAGRGAGAPGGASVGRGAGAAAPCAMPGVPASVTHTLKPRQCPAWKHSARPSP